MKVHELIAQLQQCDPNAYVAIDGVDNLYEGWIEVSSEYVEPNDPEKDHLTVNDWQFIPRNYDLAEAQQIIVIS
ncbi:MAG: hypothetical protein ACO3UU_01525 [Minisyncoccia bacterium]